jgi:Family of unknown function (DUF6364)
MKDARLTLRVPRNLLDDAKEYASEHGTSLTRLVSEYLRQLTAKREPLADAPIVRRLSGILSQEVSVEDHQRYLEEKYGFSSSCRSPLWMAL